MLKLDDVNVNIGDFSLKNISFFVKKGEYFVILGPSGTGKTILLEAIAGLIPIKKGNIFIDKKLVNNEVPEKRNVSICYQDYMLFPHLTVFENISYGMKIKGLKKDQIRERVNLFLSQFNIEHLFNRYVNTLSGGESQRVALGRAISISPKLLLLDEPLNSLDINTKEKHEEDLKKLNQEVGQTIIHITHNFEEALSLADRIGIMNNGEMIQVGTPDEIFRKPGSKFVADFVGGENLFKARITKSNGVKFAEVGNVTIQISIDSKKTQGYISIRADEIILSYKKINSSARNCFSGKITEIKKRGILTKIKVDIGIPLIVLITRKSLEEMRIKIGKKIYCIFKASSVHFF